MVAKKDIDLLPNRRYVNVTMAAASTTAVQTTIHTDMVGRTKVGWLIHRVEMRPRGVLTTPCGASNMHMRGQLATGVGEAVAALYNADDRRVVANLDIGFVFAAAGDGRDSFSWPVMWAGPVVIAARDVVCILDCGVDGAPFQNMDMLFTIWYNRVALELATLWDIKEAQGAY